jgi:hypothetical protein
MPSARIITRSQVCARELALDLLSRGYCVEIVSPDRIPNNFADLELRVDAGPDGELISNIEAHSGKRTASLDLVHHLKTPMAEFVRRPIERVARISEVVNFAAGPRVEGIGDGRLVAASQIEAKSIAHATGELLRDPEPDLKDNEKDNEYRIAQRENLSAAPTRSIATELLASTDVRTATMLPPHERARGGFWSASFTFAIIVLLALLLWVGIRQSGKAAQLSRGTGSEKVVPTSANSFRANDSVKNNSYQNGSANSQAAAPPAETAGVGNRVSHLHEDDYVARDTVIYLDKRVADEAAAKAHLAKHRTRRSPTAHAASDGVIAANSVTFLNAKPAAKGRKQNSVEAAGSNSK